MIDEYGYVPCFLDHDWTWPEGAICDECYDVDCLLVCMCCGIVDRKCWDDV